VKKLLLIDPFNGASGDMLLAALLDAGFELQSLRAGLLGIPALSGVTMEARRVTKGFFAATRLEVNLPKKHAHRGLTEVTKIVNEAATLSAPVKAHAVETFTVLAEAEAKVHGTTVDEIHFHEVGALDAIVDVVGFYLAVEGLGIDQMRYTNLVLGSGTTECLHGEIPLPAPATLELLKGHRVVFSGRNEELVTPTAAAIIAAGFEPLRRDASIVAENTGYGAGTREGTHLPNVLRIAIGPAVEMSQRVSIVRTTIDDMNPEIYGYLMDRLFAQGVFEVYYHPVMMKKNRPGLEITVITEEKDERRIVDFLMAHTTTLGVRVSREERVEIPRRTETIATELGDAQVKIGMLPGGEEKVSPEFESCKALSEKSGLPIIEVFGVVRRAWENKSKDR
jgi:uncharacterized protein (TIGR00299 family) protein